MDAALFQALESGAVVVTATNRLSAHLRARYRAAQRRAGRAVWESPAVLPLAAWLARTWDEIGEFSDSGAHPLLLPAAVGSALWEQIIRESKAGPRLLHPERAAELAEQAYGLMHAWRVPLTGAGVSEEVKAFREWCAAFDQRCADEGWLAAARLPDTIRERVTRGAALVPRSIVFAGFDDLPPQTAALGEALRGRGAVVKAWNAPPAAPASPSVRVVIPDPEAEIEAAARWARALLEQGAVPPDGEPMGIIVPDLPNRRRAIERIFHEILDPETPLREPSANRPFNLSAAPALAEVPSVRAALDWLQPLRRPTPFDGVSAMLRSPFLAGAESETGVRARLDAQLRRLNRAELSWEWVGRFAGQGGETARASCPILSERLRQAAEHEDAFTADGAKQQSPKQQGPKQHSAVAWAEFFDRRLRRILGWPGERTHSSHEQQAVEAWRELLGEFAALDLVLAPMTQRDAAARLRRLAQQKQHQPWSESAPVQILGVLESGGLTFSNLWMLGFHDELWPPLAHPNPFLPIQAQRQLGVAHASPQREFEFAQRETARILASAPRVIASHAAHMEDRVLSVSPLLESLSTEDPSRIERSTQGTWRALVHAAGNLETLSDFRAPSLVPGPQSGGVRLFQDQSACPFLAFARHRLHAESLEEPVPGLSARERGTFVHKALDRVWEQVRTHAALLEFSEGELRELSRRAAEAAVVDETGDRFRTALLNLEQERLAGLLMTELLIEKARAPFEVLAREEPREASFGGVTVRTRVDRIDRLPGGGHVLIDYKSGASAVTPAAWLGQRPDEPQLPLYCASSDLPVAAVVFARVSQRALRETVKSARQPKLFVGLSDSAEWFPRQEFSSVGLFSEFAQKGTGAAFGSRDEAVRMWRGTLDALGNRFRDGDASVDPKRSAAGLALPCEHCDLQPLCRIHEIARRTDEEAEATGGEAADD